MQYTGYEVGGGEFPSGLLGEVEGSGGGAGPSLDEAAVVGFNKIRGGGRFLWVCMKEEDEFPGAGGLVSNGVLFPRPSE